MNNNEISENQVSTINALSEEIIILSQDIIESVTECANADNSSTRKIRELYRSLTPLLEQFNKEILDNGLDNNMSSAYVAFLEHCNKMDILVTFDVSNNSEVEKAIGYMYEMSNKVRKVMK